MEAIAGDRPCRGVSGAINVVCEESMGSRGKYGPGRGVKTRRKNDGEAVVECVVCKLAATTAGATFTTSKGNRRQKQSLQETERSRDLTLNFGTRCMAELSGLRKVARRHTLLP